jgi:N6-adenosine-specific RNA methylase IME4
MPDERDRRALRAAEKKARRARLEAELGARQRALPQKRYGVIYADPPWRFEPYSRITGMDRAAENHYPTSPLAEIKALDVIGTWGFAHKTCAVWNKDRIGTGYWFRNKHEILLVGTRRHVPAPAIGTQWPSLVGARVGRHSEKPTIFYDMIESYFPTLPKIELHARGVVPRSGWDVWGLEAPAPEGPRSSGGDRHSQISPI